MEIHSVAGHLIRRLHQISTRIFTTRTQEAGFDLTSVQFAAMDAIRAHPGIDQAGVAALIAYDRATIGGVIDRLEQKSIIVRTVNSRDRRAREISMTPKGNELYSALQPVVQSLQREILQRLDETEHATFMALLQKAVNDPHD